MISSHKSQWTRLSFFLYFFFGSIKLYIYIYIYTQNMYCLYNTIHHFRPKYKAAHCINLSREGKLTCSSRFADGIMKIKFILAAYCCTQVCIVTNWNRRSNWIYIYIDHYHGRRYNFLNTQYQSRTNTIYNLLFSWSYRSV